MRFLSTPCTERRNSLDTLRAPIAHLIERRLRMTLKRLRVGLAEEVFLEVLAHDGGLAQDDELPL
eukprot:8336002-Alexandrium_andersonii.AAC.1